MIATSTAVSPASAFLRVLGRPMSAYQKEMSPILRGWVMSHLRVGPTLAWGLIKRKDQAAISRSSQVRNDTSGARAGVVSGQTR